MKILVTAFEPFGGDRLNASQEVLSALPERIDDLQIEKCCLPVVFRAASDVALAAAERLRPDAIVCLGQAGGRDCVTPERVAVNLMDAAMPDNEGFRPVDEPVVPGGPAAYFSTLPVKAMADAMRLADVPARLSNTAGTYVCNSLLYAMLHWAQAQPREIPCGFLHLPYFTEQRPPDGIPSLARETVLRGVTAALRTLKNESASSKGRNEHAHHL